MDGDRGLWERICRGDGGAFEAFYHETGPRLRSFLTRLLGNADTAEDVMQETFALLWRRPNGFRPERGSLRGYVFGIGRKRAAEWQRQHATSSVTKVESPARHPAAQAAIGDALMRLDPDERSLLWLREVEGYSYQELSTILQIPLGTVKSRLFSARERLRIVWNGNRVEKKESV